MALRLINTTLCIKCNGNGCAACKNRGEHTQEVSCSNCVYYTYKSLGFCNKIDRTVSPLHGCLEWRKRG